MSAAPESDLALSPDQDRAGTILVDRILAGHQVSSLAGAAGTGKTTLVRWIAQKLVELGFYVFYGAPTGKAASRLQDVVMSPVHTVHSLLYRRVITSSRGRPVFMDQRESLVEGGMRSVFIIDEASMIGEDLAAAVLKSAGSKTQVIYVGDQEQLMPVAAKPGVDLASADAILTQVHRQALESPILAVATMVREGKRMPDGKIGDSYERRRGSVQDAAAWLAARMDAGVDSVVLVSTNNLRSRINRMVRILRGFRGDVPVVGEQLVILTNNKEVGRNNGETIVVRAVEHLPGPLQRMGLVRISADDDRYLIHPASMGADHQAYACLKNRISAVTSSAWLLNVDWGNALTVWKSQGSEFQDVCIVTDDATKWRFRNRAGGAEEARRLAYTALTRGKKNALVLDVP